jgi:hypothetical protein
MRSFHEIRGKEEKSRLRHLLLSDITIHEESHKVERVDGNEGSQEHEAGRKNAAWLIQTSDYVGKVTSMQFPQGKIVR